MTAMLCPWCEREGARDPLPTMERVAPPHSPTALNTTTGPGDRLVCPGCHASVPEEHAIAMARLVRLERWAEATIERVGFALSTQQGGGMEVGCPDEWSYIPRSTLIAIRREIRHALGG